ncbi:MAG: radical protein [Labilithrix sp.]|nr:radical protein [Labilithrix sp.]
MKVALVNPPWSFEGSIYFGCREPHLPLELGYSKALLEAAGHEVLLVDAQLGFAWASGASDAVPCGNDLASVHEALRQFGPALTALTTAPSYLFWRCAPPELRVPMRTREALRDVAGQVVVIGPHASTTPGVTLRKLDADFAILGECEDVLAALASAPPADRGAIPSVIAHERGAPCPGGARHSTDLRALPALRWPDRVVRAHSHHHHRFDREPSGPGAELEASRGCPYSCTFCAKDNFRNGFRKRPLEVILAELDGLIAQGVTYVYFIDEIFLPDAKLLNALVERPIQFGVQMRIDNWNDAMLELLGRAGCVSIEAGMESVTERGRSLLGKHCKLTTEQLTRLLVVAKQHVPFVQANLLDATTDRPEDVAAWRARLSANGVWSNEPVPLFPYPGSPEYVLRFGVADDRAWERAHEHYLTEFAAFSDIQEGLPRPLPELEASGA